MTSINPNLTTRKSLEAWLRSYHDATKALNAHFVVDRFYTSDIEVQYANNPPAVGKETVEGFFDAAFKALDYLHHEIVYFDFVPAEDRLYQAARIDYVVKGDDKESQTISIPAMLAVWLVEEDGRLKMKRSEIFLDGSQVFGRMAEKGLI